MASSLRDRRPCGAHAYEINAVDGLVRHTVPVDRPDNHYTLKNALRDTRSPRPQTWPLAAAGMLLSLAARRATQCPCRWPARVKITRTATQTTYHIDPDDTRPPVAVGTRRERVGVPPPRVFSKRSLAGLGGHRKAGDPMVVRGSGRFADRAEVLHELLQRVNVQLPRGWAQCVRDVA